MDQRKLYDRKRSNIIISLMSSRWFSRSDFLSFAYNPMYPCSVRLILALFILSGSVCWACGFFLSNFGILFDMNSLCTHVDEHKVLYKVFNVENCGQLAEDQQASCKDPGSKYFMLGRCFLFSLHQLLSSAAVTCEHINRCAELPSNIIMVHPYGCWIWIFF